MAYLARNIDAELLKWKECLQNVESGGMSLTS